MSATTFVPIERLELSFVRHEWAFANQRRSEIDDYFAALQRDRPGVWNGQVLLERGEPELSGGVLRGDCFETDYASFMAWKAWGAPDRSVRNIFAQGALRSADGAYILGVMADYTANAGQIYFPCGTPDLHDIVGGTVDLAANVLREVAEETGLLPGDFDVRPGWVASLSGAFVTLTQILESRIDAQGLSRRILDHLAAEARPELSSIRIVRSRADFGPAMLDFAITYMAYTWREGDDKA